MVERREGQDPFRVAGKGLAYPTGLPAGVVELVQGDRGTRGRVRDQVVARVAGGGQAHLAGRE
jgi:hypothetical protein